MCGPRCIVTALAVLFLSLPTAEAGFIDVYTVDPPDICAHFISTSYNATTGAFTASGWTQEFQDSTTTHTVTGGGTYTLNATIDNSGNLLGGTLQITGGIASLGIANGSTLLSGTLTQIGFPDPGDAGPLEFLFTVTGGELASSYGPAGYTSLADSGFAPTAGFGTNFSASFAATADTLSTPAPSGLALMMSFGMSAFGWVKLRSRRIQPTQQT